MSEDKKRWGYASYNMDDEDDERLTYTRYEEKDSVNKYTDNGDGGHSHSHWNNSEDYNNGEEPDQHRSESNKSENPSTGEVDEKSGCFLTTACMNSIQNDFNDNCYELELLRWFRDNFVSKEDIKYYYKIAPIIVEVLNNIPSNKNIYEYIYENVVLACIKDINQEYYEQAYTRYETSVLDLEETYARPALEKKLVNTLKKIKK